MINRKAKGTRLERDLVNFFRDIGLFAMRAPASLGIDVVAIRAGVAYGFEVTAEPCKRSWKLERIVNECAAFGLVPMWATPGPRGEGLVLEHLAPGSVDPRVCCERDDIRK